MESGILTGIRVLDLAAHRAGQMAARMLAEAGADVIKVEPPGGDVARREPGYIVSNRSKRSLVLDLDSAEGRRELTRLLGGADVLVHDLGPTAALARGLDDASLQAHPQLVVCGITPFPLSHPGADARHSESLMNARIGTCDEQAASRRLDGPIYLRAPIATMCTWSLAAAGIVARLIARERDGAGGAAHTSLLQGYLVSLGLLWSRAERPDEAFARALTKANGTVMGSGVPRYQCGDGEWMYVMGPPELLPAMQEILAGMGVMVPADTHSRRPTDGGWPGVGQDARIKAFQQRARSEWLRDMWALDIPAAPCLRIGELFLDEQAVLNDYVVEVDDPRHGRTRQAGLPFVTVPPSVVRCAAPEPGEHSGAVLAEDWSPRFRVRGRASGVPPLAGYKVLDFGQFLSSPTAPMLMAHLGADVIKIEPTTGDGMRATPTRPWIPGRSYSQVNRGKRCIAVDLKDGATRSLLEDMIRWADVFHHNVRYDATRRLRLDDESLRKVNPRLVYCHTSAYGHTGPRAGWPGFDPLMQGYSGWSMAGAGEGNPPIWHRTGFVDFMCGLQSLVATLLALFHRNRTGVGQMCSSSLLAGAAVSLSEVFMRADGSIPPLPALDANQTGVSPFDRIYQCVDRNWIAVLAESDEEKQSLLKAFEAKGVDDLEARVGRFSQDHAIYKCRVAGVTAEAVRLNGTELFYESRVNQEAGLTVKHRSAEFGELEQPGHYWNMGETKLLVDPPPPALGEHTREICARFGVPDDVYARLEATGQLLQMPKTAEAKK